MPMQQLLLLLVGVPPTPSSLRVRVWRRLRSLGAVPLKRSAYLLPDTPERYEDFRWLAQEIEREGGEATLIRIQQIENISPENVQRLLHEPRDHDYRQLAARYRKVLQSLDKKPVVKGARLPEELAHLAREHQRIRDIDYFDAPSGAEVRRLEEVIAMRNRKSTRLNSSHLGISYAVFCLKKKKVLTAGTGEMPGVLEAVAAGIGWDGTALT